MLPLILVLAASAQQIVSQPEQPRLDTVLEERVSVSLRTVDVLVVDKRGRPVVDLHKEEVGLWDGGLKQTVLDLLPAHAMPGGGGPNAASTPPVVSRGETRMDRGLQTNRRWIVLLFDAGNLSLQGRVRAGAALRQLVEDGLREGDRVSLMVDDPDELRVVVPFTTHHERLLPHLRDPAGISNRSRDLVLRLSELRENVESCRDASDPLRCARQTGSSFVFEAGRETEASMAHLETLLRGLGAIPDRKLLFYVSEGLLVDPGDVAAAAVQHALGPTGHGASATRLFLTSNYRSRLERLYQAATDSRTGFYVVNTGRKMTDEPFSAERAMEGGPYDLPQARTDPFEAAWQQVHALHADLARTTGGRVVFRKDPAGFLEDPLATADGVYTVSYTPKLHSPEGTKVKIKIARRNTRVLYRNSSYRKASEAHRLAGDLVIFQDGADRAAGIVRAELKVAAAHLSLVPDSDPPVSIVSLFFDLTNGGGAPLKDSYELISLPRGTQEDVINGEFRRPFALKVPPGEYRLRIDLCDTHGDARGSFHLRFVIGADSRLEATGPGR